MWGPELFPPDPELPTEADISQAGSHAARLEDSAQGHLQCVLGGEGQGEAAAVLLGISLSLLLSSLCSEWGAKGEYEGCP